MQASKKKVIIKVGNATMPIQRHDYGMRAQTNEGVAQIACELGSGDHGPIIPVHGLCIHLRHHFWCGQRYVPLAAAVTASRLIVPQHMPA